MTSTAAPALPAAIASLIAGTTPTPFATLLVHATLTQRTLRLLPAGARARIGWEAQAALHLAADDRTRLVALHVLDLVEGAYTRPGEGVSFYRGDHTWSARSERGERTARPTAAELATWA